jgi:hypothetical protein
MKAQGKVSGGKRTRLMLDKHTLWRSVCGERDFRKIAHRSGTQLKIPAEIGHFWPRSPGHRGGKIIHMFLLRLQQHQDFTQETRRRHILP